MFCACNRGLFLLEKGIGIAKNTPYITKLKPFFGKKWGLFSLKIDLFKRHKTKHIIIFLLCPQKVGISLRLFFQNDTSFTSGICSYCIFKAKRRPHFLPKKIQLVLSKKEPVEPRNHVQNSWRDSIHIYVYIYPRQMLFRVDPSPQNFNWL